jgi:hypothetical protein
MVTCDVLEAVQALVRAVHFLRERNAHVDRKS